MSLRLSTSNTALIQKFWNSKLQRDSHLDDPYTDIMGVLADERKPLPESAITKIIAPKGTRQHTMGLLKHLSGFGAEGRDDILGNEEDQAVRQITLYANEVKHAVNTDQYGVDAIDKEAYNILATVQPQLSFWHKERKGKYFREAACELFSSNLEKAPTSQTQHINKNVMIAGTALASQPAYDTVAGGTFDNNIQTAVTAIGTTTASQMSISLLNDVIEFCVSRQIEPVNMDGRPKWVLMVSTASAKLLRAPGTSGQLGNMYVNADARGGNNKAIKAVIGDYGPLILIEDPRSPRATIASNTVTFGYYDVGSTDGRAALGTTVWDANIILGKGALGLLEAEALHFEDEVQAYGQSVGVGAFATYGIQAMEFGLDTATAASQHNKNLGILFTITATA